MHSEFPAITTASKNVTKHILND